MKKLIIETIKPKLK